MDLKNKSPGNPALDIASQLVTFAISSVNLQGAAFASELRE